MGRLPPGRVQSAFVLQPLPRRSSYFFQTDGAEWKTPTTVAMSVYGTDSVHVPATLATQRKPKYGRTSDADCGAQTPVPLRTSVGSEMYAVPDGQTNGVPFSSVSVCQSADGAVATPRNPVVHSDTFPIVP